MEPQKEEEARRWQGLASVAWLQPKAGGICEVGADMLDSRCQDIVIILEIIKNVGSHEADALELCVLSQSLWI